MCGIVGAVAQRDVANILVMGLQSLEYRGYDSAGVATKMVQAALIVFVVLARCSLWLIA